MPSVYVCSFTTRTLAHVTLPSTKFVNTVQKVMVARRFELATSRVYDERLSTDANKTSMVIYVVKLGQFVLLADLFIWKTLSWERVTAFAMAFFLRKGEKHVPGTCRSARSRVKAYIPPNKSVN